MKNKKSASGYNYIPCFFLLIKSLAYLNFRHFFGSVQGFKGYYLMDTGRIVLVVVLVLVLGGLSSALISNIRFSRTRTRTSTIGTVTG
jgi:hypothetical protein